MSKITIRKEKIFGRLAYVVLKNNRPTEFRFTKTGAETLARKLRKKR